MNSDLIANHRPQVDGGPLADVDLEILRALARDARMSNKDLAEAVGIAPSTCSGRVAGLVERGVITGFRAEIDHESLGLHVFGMIAVRVTPMGRTQIAAVIERLLAVPSTLEVFQVSGERDLLVHIAVDRPASLHRYIEDHLAGTEIAHTQTSLVFGHHRA